MFNASDRLLSNKHNYNKSWRKEMQREVTGKLLGFG